MKSYDFEYDGLHLSSFGLMICDFDFDGKKTISNGSQITFNTVSTQKGAKHELVSSEYEDCITTTFQICKHPCITDGNEEITISELREITKWLNRKGYHKFKLLDDFEHKDIFFEASFNISRIEINGKLYGLELEMFTNRPYALHEPIVINIKNIQKNGTKRIYSKSDDEGYIYPKMEIVIEEDGDFEIYNSLEDRTMRIANCKVGEIIKLDYPTIETSLSSHKIQNDFNWKFFRIANSFRDGANEITISLPCTIKVTYCPIVKVGI